MHSTPPQPNATTTRRQEQREGGAMQRRHALGQAMGKLALIAGAGSWAAGLGPFSAGGVLPAHAETTAVKKVGGDASAARIFELHSMARACDG